MTPEVRLSPDWTRVAIRSGLQQDWEVTGGVSGLRLTNEQVRGWIPMSINDSLVCPWCYKEIRPTSKGVLYSHSQPDVFPPQHCEGSGRRPSDYAAVQAKRSAA